MPALLALAVSMLIGACVYGAIMADRYAEARGEVKVLKGALAQANDTLTVYKARAAKSDTVWRVKVKPVWDSVRVTDTVRIDSVVYVPLAAADSAVGSCTRALDACQVAGIKAQAVMDQQAALIKVLEKRPGPCRVLKVRCELITGVAGLAAGVLLAK